MAVLLFAPGVANPLIEPLLALEVGADPQAASATALPNNEPRVPTELINKARERRAVRVIVQLRVPENAREPAIEAVKQAVRTEISPTLHRVVRELRGLPLLAIEVSADALRVLNASPHVLRVQEDTVARPQR